MKSTYLLNGIRLSNLVKMVWKYGISLHPRSLVRFFLVFQSSLWASFFGFLDRLYFKKKLENLELPSDPIFIVGHWRTGSTFLHQILFCDPKLTAPTVMQCCYPEGFLKGEPFLAPILKRAGGGTRPFDNVRNGPGEPQEDEFALLRMTLQSPLIKLLFPKNGDYFLLDGGKISSDELLDENWKKSLILFCKKIYLKTGKRLVLKNPFNSSRIPQLQKLFPNALYIHIVRDPRRVIPSTKRLWTIVGEQNVMKNHWRPPKLEEVIKAYDSIQWTLRNDITAIDEKNRFEVKYEDLEKDPINTIQKMYNHLGLDFSSEFKVAIKSFLMDVRDYQKNSFDLKSDVIQTICSNLKHHMEFYGYL